MLRYYALIYGQVKHFQICVPWFLHIDDSKQMSNYHCASSLGWAGADGKGAAGGHSPRPQPAAAPGVDSRLSHVFPSRHCGMFFVVKSIKAYFFSG